jgi:hypothetical protein
MQVAESRFGIKQGAILVLGLGTAIIHLQLLFPDAMFILNGLGYLTLLAAYFLPLPWVRDNRSVVRWAFMAFTAVTILAWVFIGARSPLGYLTKVIEVVLVALLFMDQPEG